MEDILRFFPCQYDECKIVQKDVNHLHLELYNSEFHPSTLEVTFYCLECGRESEYTIIETNPIYLTLLDLFERQGE